VIWAASCGLPGVAPLGSAALDLAYVPRGRYDGYWEAPVEQMDVAAGLFDRCVKPVAWSSHWKKNLKATFWNDWEIVLARMRALFSGFCEIATR